MSLVASVMRDFAERLIAYEAKINKSSDVKKAIFCLPCENLRPHLVILMGNVGFNALLSRALTLTKEEIVWLRTVSVKDDGSLQGWQEIAQKISPDKIFEAEVDLLTQLLALLVAFIGKDLTLRLVHEAWPKLSLNDVDFGKGL